MISFCTPCLPSELFLLLLVSIRSEITLEKNHLPYLSGDQYIQYTWTFRVYKVWQNSLPYNSPHPCLLHFPKGLLSPHWIFGVSQPLWQSLLTTLLRPKLMELGKLLLAGNQHREVWIKKALHGPAIKPWDLLENLKSQREAACC